MGTSDEDFVRAVFRRAQEDDPPFDMEALVRAVVPKSNDAAEVPATQPAIDNSATASPSTAPQRRHLSRGSAHLVAQSQKKSPHGPTTRRTPTARSSGSRPMHHQHRITPDLPARSHAHQSTYTRSTLLVGLITLITAAVVLVVGDTFKQTYYGPTTIGPAVPGVEMPTEDQWLKLRTCESGDNYALNTDDKYYGAYQFDSWRWARAGGEGLPNEAPPVVQDTVAKLIYQETGWAIWRDCADKLGFQDSSDTPTILGPEYVGSLSIKNAHTPRSNAALATNDAVSITGSYDESANDLKDWDGTVHVYFGGAGVVGKAVATSTTLSEGFAANIPSPSEDPTVPLEVCVYLIKPDISSIRAGCKPVNFER